MVSHKRHDKYSTGEVIFSHQHVVDFLSHHKDHLYSNQAIKVFILNSRFRLTLTYLAVEGTKFEMDFFNFAVQANAFDIAFYLRYRFEEQLFANASRAIDIMVQSFQDSPRNMKAKIFMSKSLLPVYNFNGVKKFLYIMNQKMTQPALENNVICHSANPLLNLCLLYEFLFLVSKKFVSLSYTCKDMMDKVKQMVLEYIETVDDENYLTTITLERDFANRDSLTIAVELELLELVQNPKIEAIISRIWQSDFEVNGSFFEMSTPFKILQQPSNADVDVEELNRFYKKRDIENCAQYDSNFNIFQYSMYSRLKGMALIALLYVIISIICYEQVTSMIIYLRPQIVVLGRQL